MNPDTSHISPVGLWSWDVQRDMVFTDDVACQYFNVSAREGHEGRPLHQLLEAIHPEDLPAVDRSIRGALGGAPFRLRYRVLSHQLGERVVLANGRCFLDQNGNPIFYPGFVMDISETAGTTIERLSGHLTAGLELARGIGDPALSYLLEAARIEADRLRNSHASGLN